MEFAKCRALTNQSNVGEKHCKQNALMAYTTKPGSQKISDTATTMENVFERRKFWFCVERLWKTCNSGVVTDNRERIDR